MFRLKKNQTLGKIIHVKLNILLYFQGGIDLYIYIYIYSNHTLNKPLNY